MTRTRPSTSTPVPAVAKPAIGEEGLRSARTLRQSPIRQEPEKTAFAIAQVQDNPWWTSERGPGFGNFLDDPIEII